jgi:hypothetical protein
LDHLNHQTNLKTRVKTLMEHIVTYNVLVGNFTWTGNSMAGQDTYHIPKLAFNQMTGVFKVVERFCNQPSGSTVVTSPQIVDALNDFVQRSRMRKAREDKKIEKQVRNANAVKIEKIMFGDN